MIRTIVLLMAAFAFIDPPAAGGAACVRPNGKLISREVCRRSERPFDAAAFSPVGATGEAGAPGNRGQFPLAILDAADREVGTVLSFAFGTALLSVTHPTFPAPVSFAVSRNGFGNLGDDVFASVFYAEAGCAGQPYLPSGLRPYAHVEGTAAYRVVGSAGSVDVLSGETDAFMLCLSSNVTDRGTCCMSETFTEVLVPTVRTPIADLGFTPPFRAVLR